MVRAIFKLLGSIFSFLLSRREINYIGTKILVPRGLDWRTRWQIYARKYEIPEIDAIFSQASKGNKFLEIGGGAGIISAIISQQMQPKEHLVYEALQENFDRINEQPLSDATTVMHSAVVPSNFKEQEVVFFRKARIFGSGIFSSSVGGDSSEGWKVSVPAQRVSDIAIEGFDVILVDVEGAEGEIIPEILSRARGKVIFEFHPDKCELSLGELIPADFFARTQYLSGSTFLIDTRAK